jgi:hypothetical protein
MLFNQTPESNVENIRAHPDAKRTLPQSLQQSSLRLARIRLIAHSHIVVRTRCTKNHLVNPATLAHWRPRLVRRWCGRGGEERLTGALRSEGVGRVSDGHCLRKALCAGEKVHGITTARVRVVEVAVVLVLFGPACVLDIRAIVW